jgi:hypothetical protein
MSRHLHTWSTFRREIERYERDIATEHLRFPRKSQAFGTARGPRSVRYLDLCV